MVNMYQIFFPISDAAKFPSVIHAQKRDPATNLQNSTYVRYTSLA